MITAHRAFPSAESVHGGSRQGRLTASTVKETVADLDGIVDDVGANVVRDLPEAEAHLGHVVAAVKLDDGSHFVVLCNRPRCRPLNECPGVYSRQESRCTTTRGKRLAVATRQEKDSLARAGSVHEGGSIEAQWMDDWETNSGGSPKASRSSRGIYTAPLLHPLSLEGLGGGGCHPAHAIAPPTPRRAALHLDDMPPRRVIPARLSQATHQPLPFPLAGPAPSSMPHRPGAQKLQRSTYTTQRVFLIRAGSMPRLHDRSQVPVAVENRVPLLANGVDG